MRSSPRTGRPRSRGSPRRALKPGGALALEVGDGQARAVAAVLEELGYHDVTITVDLNGRERIVEGRIG